MSEEELEAKIEEVRNQLANTTDSIQRAKLNRLYEQHLQQLTRLRSGTNAAASPLAGAQAGPPMTGINAGNSPLSGQPAGSGGKRNNFLDQTSERGQQALDDFKKKFSADEIKKATIDAARVAWAGIRAVIGPIIAFLGPWIAGGIAAILLVVMIAVILGQIHLPGPKEGGGGLLQNVNPVTDREWLNRFMLMTGDPDVISKFDAVFAQKLTDHLTTALDEVEKLDGNTYARKQDLKNDLINIKNLLRQYNEITTSEKDEDKQKKAREIIAACQALSKYASAEIKRYPELGKTSLPFKVLETKQGSDGEIDYYIESASGKKLLAYGQSLHLQTLRMTSQENSSNSHTTIMFNKKTGMQDRGDAGDFYSFEKGTPVFAAFDGTVEKKKKRSKGDYWIRIRSDNKQFVAVYAHLINLSVNENQHVSAGEKIGEISVDHLHFEIMIDGLPVNYTDEDIKKCGIVPVSGDYGKSKGCSNGKAINYYYWKYVTILFQEQG